MRKIKYPKGNELELFHKAYLKYFRIDDRKERHYRYFKESVIDVDLPDSLADLLILSFNDIADISFRLNLTLSQRKWLKMFFNYKTWQPKIASFFMEHQVILGLGSCFYCNIDYINIFSDIKDYKDGIDLIKRGSLNDLKKIKSIKPEIAEQIFANRDTTNSVAELVLSDLKKKNIDEINLAKKHNHFTLDHVLGKDAFPLFALCLYNLVPSCYSCNSKFKRIHDLVENVGEAFLSPTSANSEFCENVEFDLFFDKAGKDILSLSSTSEFLLTFKFHDKEEHYTKFIDAFKLHGRYKFHKSVVLRLIKRKRMYDESQINEIAKIFNYQPEAIYNTVFGEELFNNDMDDQPFIKLKRDVAKMIGIPNVL